MAKKSIADDYGVTAGPSGDVGVDLSESTDMPFPAAEDKPDPKPGDSDYDWAPHYPHGAELYTHTYPNGTVVAIRRFKDIYSKQWLRSIRNLKTDFDIEDAAINRAACDVAQAVIDSVPCPVGEPDQFELLFKAWQQADTEGLTTGE